MALIKNAKGRRAGQAPSGYTRVFGIEELGNLMSRVQGTVISAGNELEKLILERCKTIDDLDTFVANLSSREAGVFVATKAQVKKSKSINSRYEPDFLAFDLVKRVCYVIEVKDGDQLDTKKASGEHTTLKNFTNDVSQALSFSFEIYICGFNANTKEEIWHGIKKKFALSEILTGKELCVLFNIDFNEIIKIRTADQQSNLEYFIEEMLKIPNIKNMINKRLKG